MVKGKKEYEINCQYCYSHTQNADVWSICYDFMDKKIWSGYGYFIEDNGIKTIDYIMNKWGFEKTKHQTNIFDFI